MVSKLLDLLSFAGTKKTEQPLAASAIFVMFCWVQENVKKKRILVTKFVNENVIRLGFSMKEESQ